MAVTRISIVTPDLAATDADRINALANSPQALTRLAQFISDIAGGNRIGKVRLNTGAVQAEGSMVFASFIADDTVVINGNTFTGKASPSGANQFAIGSTDQDCANNLMAKINASALAKVVGTVVAYRRGTQLLSSFVTTDTVTINGVVFTGKTTPTAGDDRQFAIGGSDAKTAENLMNAISKCAISPYGNLLGNILAISRSTATLTIDYAGSLTIAVSAHGTATSKTVMVRAIAGGQAGNLFTITTGGGHGTATSPTGGTEGTETIFAVSRTIL